MTRAIQVDQINTATLKFLEPINLQQTYETITHQAMLLLDGLDGFVMLADEKGELRVVYASSDFDLEGAIKTNAIYQAFEEKKAVILHPDGELQAVIIPLYYQNKSFGILLIRTEKCIELHEDDFELLKMFGSLATLGIRKAQLYEDNQKSIKIRDIFASMAAHELKTPLTTISGYVQLLDSRMKNKESQESEWVKNLLTETKRMNELIKDLLQTHNIKSGKLQFKWQECHLTEILQKCILTCQFSHPKRQVFITSLLEPSKDIVIGDCDKLQQVFDNLLDNACKFSAASSPVQIDVYAEEPFIAIEIIDKGMGISKSDLPHVFEEFYKSSMNEHSEGMGLGLYLVKMILNQHHGKIQISSSKRGTKVTVKLRRVEL